VIKYLVLATLPLFFSEYSWDDNSEIYYEVYEEGPRTVYKGEARLHWDENTTACINYTFDLVPGRLAGPWISSDPGQPMLSFDEVQIFDDHLFVSWERNRTDLQDNPTQCPRYFIFYIIKTEFTADDLSDLLNDWGKENSVWDLDGDNTVGGTDLSLVLGGWKID